MKILKILPNNVGENSPEMEQLRRRGHQVEIMRPALLSALTAASVASRLKGAGADRVEVERLKDAVAAVSARKLVPDIGFEIAVRAPRNSEPWRHISRIDGEDIRWIFPSERLRTAFGRHGELELPDMPTAEADTHDRVFTRFAFLGSEVLSPQEEAQQIARLKEAVESVAKREGVVLDVYGEFKARYVMPVVRRCRALEIESRVVWHGKDYVLKEAVENSDCVFLSQYEPTDTELLAAGYGKPLTDKI